MQSNKTKKEAMKKGRAFLEFFKSKNNMKTKIFLFCMMFLPFLFGVGYDLFNKAYTIKLMFSDEAGSGFGTFYIAKAFKELSSATSSLSVAIKNVFLVPAFFNFVCLPLQLLVAYFLYRNIPFTKAFRIILYLPCLISSVVSSSVFFVIFQSEGALCTMLSTIGFEIPTEGLFQSKETAMGMILLYQFWCGSGVTITLATAAMRQINPEMIEASRIDGIGFWGELFKMVLPSMLPMLSVWVVQNMASGFGYYTEVLLFTPTPTESGTISAAYLINEKARSLGRAQFESAGYGFIFTLIAIPLIYGVRKILEKVIPDDAY